MRVLAFDAGGEVGGAAVADGHHCLASRAFPAGRSAGPQLLPAIAEVLEAAGLELSELDALALVPGPGSFAGARIALATARGLDLGLTAEAWLGQQPPAAEKRASMPCVAAPAGWLLAQTAAHERGPATTFALARISRRLLLCERFDFGAEGSPAGGVPHKASERLGTPQELAAWLKQQLSTQPQSEVSRLLGADAAALHAEVDHAALARVELAPAATLIYLATHYVEVARCLGVSTVASVEPIYARPAYVDDAPPVSAGA